MLSQLIRALRSLASILRIFAQIPVASAVYCGVFTGYAIIKRELPPSLAGDTEKPLGNDLLSQEVALQVPSALTDLTAGFGM